MKNIFFVLLLLLLPVIGFAQASSPDTSIYKVFSSGGSCLVPLDALLQWGAKSIGRSCGQFIATTAEVEQMIAKAKKKKKNCYDVHDFELGLGIPGNAWAGKIMVRIDIPADSLRSLNLRWPQRTDCGVNSDWKPGGKTSGGLWEGFVDQLPSGYFVLKADLLPCY